MAFIEVLLSPSLNALDCQSDSLVFYTTLLVYLKEKDKLWILKLRVHRELTSCGENMLKNTCDIALATPHCLVMMLKNSAAEASTKRLSSLLGKPVPCKGSNAHNTKESGEHGLSIVDNLLCW